MIYLPHARLTTLYRFIIRRSCQIQYSFGDISESDITKLEVSYQIMRGRFNFIWPKFWDPWQRCSVPRASPNIYFNSISIFNISYIHLMKKVGKLSVGWNQLQEKKLIKKVFIWIIVKIRNDYLWSGCSSLSDTGNFKGAKGEKVGEKQMVNWVVSTHSGGTAL